MGWNQLSNAGLSFIIMVAYESLGKDTPPQSLLFFDMLMVQQYFTTKPNLGITFMYLPLHFILCKFLWYVVAGRNAGFRSTFAGFDSWEKNHTYGLGRDDFFDSDDDDDKGGIQEAYTIISHSIAAAILIYNNNTGK